MPNPALPKIPTSEEAFGKIRWLTRWLRQAIAATVESDVFAGESCG
jgi:hypothetical protein